jgi:hypothetical protein
VLEEVQGEGAGDLGKQPDYGGGGVEEHDEVQGRGDQHQHLQLVGAAARLASSCTLKLSSPKDSESPGWVKSRRRKRNPDGLVQKRLEYFTTLQLNCSSENLVPSGGPIRRNENESARGIKRGMGDQMEGPCRMQKKVRKD